MNVLTMTSLVTSIAGATAVMVWRVRETRRPVTARKIILPPLGMATGFSMFFAPMFRVPWLWAASALLLGAVVLAYPLRKTSRLIREGDQVWMQRSNVFFAVLIVLAGVRLGARAYLDTVMSIPQTAGLFFILAFGMIARWRTQMYLDFRALMARPT